MPRRFPLSAKILLWCALNVILLGLLFGVFLSAQFHLGPDWLLSTANERLDAVRDIIFAELAHEPEDDWNATLQRFDSGYHDKVHFLIFNELGEQLAGKRIEAPPEIEQRLAIGRHHGPPPFDGRPPPGPRAKQMLRAGSPPRYWVILHGPGPRPDMPGSPLVTLAIVAQSLSAGGLFFDVRPWIELALTAVFLSLLLWFPLVHGINRSIAQITAATGQIAAGQFETRVHQSRRDELGALGQAVNQMAERLDGLVTGQKRFLGDVAHELCSPLAKLRVALGILEQRAPAEYQGDVAQAEEEAAHIASLVNELLSFSKASLAARPVDLRPVSVRAAAAQAVRREGAARLDIPDDLRVLAEPELLTRALSNLLRNAHRYAGACGEILISARGDRTEARIAVIDHGSGVPEPELERIFDPFYRVDNSRDRNTGGVGLGLAIVKTCVASCGGIVQCANRHPKGFEAVIRLPVAKESPAPGPNIP